MTQNTAVSLVLVQSSYTNLMHSVNFKSFHYYGISAETLTSVIENSDRGISKCTLAGVHVLVQYWESTDQKNKTKIAQ